ncbi:hypothetical protein A7985_13775 [Pseudoalteromonas luteoviolacea]|uniref:Uncharacterized protein n=1 Tax=Pseudoalteromonas luteoviolacea TaxID=43657 RepID=A0A1C0TPK0_9GAMM|nr:hypothetical protein A7985_13775 [Pseudoalteromonas luteoviolacea]
MRCKVLQVEPLHLFENGFEDKLTGSNPRFNAIFALFTRVRKNTSHYIKRVSQPHQGVFLSALG